MPLNHGVDTSNLPPEIKNSFERVVRGINESATASQAISFVKELENLPRNYDYLHVAAQRLARESSRK